MKLFKKRPSPAMIVAIAALSVSLVGTAVAGPIAEISLNRGEKQQVRKISRNISGKVSNRKISRRAPGLSVATARNAVIANVANAANFSNTVIDDAITTEKIKDAGVTTEDLEDAAVTLAKLAENSVDSSKVAPNSLTSADLGSNSVGASELDALILVTADSPTVANGNSTGATATCPAGTQAISGGFDGGNGGTPWRIHRLRREGNGWRAFGTNQTGVNSFLQAEAYCLAQ